MTKENVTKIRELNDRYRKGDQNVPGKTLLTSGVQALVDDGVGLKLTELMQFIHGFDDFDQNNDPHGEHDFGSLEFENDTVFWKLDYYAPDLEHGSEDPSDTEQTIRVLTIMLASEY